MGILDIYIIHLISVRIFSYYATIEYLNWEDNWEKNLDTIGTNKLNSE